MAASSIIGWLRVNLGMNAAEFTTGSKQAASSMDRLADRAKKAGAAIGAAFAAEKLTSFAREAVTKFGIQEDAIAAVDAAIRATGGTAGFTTDQLAKMASKLQSVSTFGDEDILKNVTANFLTFGNIVGPVFERAQQAALDLSARLGQDLQSSTIQLGKALNDPIKGMTALQRVGVAFTSTQKAQVKAFIDQNQVMKAQGLILDELAKEFGGQAEAIANTTQGKLTQAANAFGDAMESIGGVIAPIVLPAAQAVKTLSEKFQELSPELQRFIVIGAGLTVGIGAAATAAGIFAVALGAIAAPIALTAGAIGVFGGFIAAWGANIGRIASAIGEYFYGIYASAKQWLYDALKPIIETVGGWVDWIGEKFAWLRQKLGLDDVAASVKSSVGSIVQGLQPYEDKLIALWKGTEEWKGSLESIQVPKLKLPEGDDPEVAAKAQAELNKSIEAGVSLVKQSETPWAKYGRQLTDLGNALKDGKITAEQFNLAQNKIFEDAKVNFEGGAELIAKYTSPYAQMTETIRKLQAQYDSGAISALALGRAQQQAVLGAAGAYVDGASSIASSLSQVFKKNKAVAIAAGTIDAIGAALNAFRQVPYPLNFAAAAAAFAAGMARVAAIRSTNEGSSGGGGGSGGSSSAAASGPTQAPQVLRVEGIDPSKSYSGGTVKDLAQALLQYQRDGGQVVLA